MLNRFAWMMVVITATSLTPAFPCRGGEIAFPPPNKDAAVSGLVLQLASDKNRCRFGEEVRLYVCFTNVGERPFLLVVSAGQLHGVDSLLRPVPGGGKGLPLFSSGSQAHLELEPNRKVLFCLGERYLPAGEHAIELAYEFSDSAPTIARDDRIWSGAVKSNRIKITVGNEPLDDAQRDALEKKCFACLETTAKVGPEERYQIQNLLLHTTPYSLPAARRALQHETPVVRINAVQVLGRVAQPGLPWTPRDTTALGDLLDAYDRERVSLVRAHMANALIFFADGMTEEQQRHATELLLKESAGKLPEQRLWAAMSLVRIDPRTAVSVLARDLMQRADDASGAQATLWGFLEHLTRTSFQRDETRLQRWWHEHAAEYPRVPPLAVEKQMPPAGRRPGAPGALASGLGGLGGLAAGLALGLALAALCFRRRRAT